MQTSRNYRPSSSAHFRAVLGARLRDTRIALGVQQRDLAALTGLRPDRLSLYESGQQPPTVSALAKIATALGLPVDNLLPDPSFVLEADLELSRLCRRIWLYPEFHRAACADLLRILCKFLDGLTAPLAAPGPAKESRHAPLR